MAATDSLSAEDQEFLAQCEEEFKHRFTENDEEYMKVYSAGQSTPPIVDNWWVSHHNHRRRNAHHPYARPGNRDFGRRDQNYRRYNDNRGYGGYDRRDQRSHHNRV